MRFPTWHEFLEKESAFEKNLAAKVEEFKDDHPMLGQAIGGLLSSLPPPFDSIASNIYAVSSGSEQEKSKDVLDYFEQLKSLGQEHYELVLDRLNEVLVQVDDLKQITAKESTVQKVQELLISSGKATDEKIDTLKDELQLMGQKVERIDETAEKTYLMQKESIHLLKELRARFPEQSKILSSQISSVSYRIAVFNKTTVITDSQVKSVVNALQTQVHRDFAPNWGVDAELTFVPKTYKPAEGSWWLVFLDKSDAPGAFAYHDLTPEGLPLAKVFVKSAKEVNIEWTIAASHELLEILVDPRINLVTLDMRHAKKARLHAYEICDPCSADSQGYKINGIAVSDFVFPAWFEDFRQPGSTQFDYMNRIKRPFEILPGGYARVWDVSLDPGWRVLTG